MRPGTDPWLVRCYRLVLTTYPPGFRLAFADSMALDFSDALRDARKDARPWAVMHLLACIAADLAWSVTRQWARTPVPWLTLGYATTIACVCEGLASATMRGKLARTPVSSLESTSRCRSSSSLATSRAVW